MAINELKDFLENGNITNSVNYPSISLGVKQAQNRVCINHKNIPGQIAHFTAVISENGGNITDFVHKSRGDFAYSIIDVDGNVDINQLQALDGVFRVRVI